MATSPLLTLLDLAMAFLTVYCLKQLFVRKPFAGTLPPGPRPLPLIGNLLDMPTEHEWYKFAEWGERYGEQVSSNIMSS